LPSSVQAKLFVAKAKVVGRLVASLCEDVAGFLNADLAHKVSNLIFDGEFAEDVDFRVVGFAVFDVKCLEIYFSVCQVDSRALVLESVC
jgi:hypothetical protein